MEDTITVIYCLVDDFLSAYGWNDDPQTEMKTSEVMTTALVAACYYGGKIEISRLFLQHHRYMTKMLSKSRLNRRLHAIPPEMWQALFSVLAGAFKAMNPTQEYIVDSFPVPVCDNIRISRCKLYPLTPEDPFRGRMAGKRRYFYGLRVHLLVTATGNPVEFALAPGKEHDLPVFREFGLELPEGAVIYADALYTDYHYEDLLEEVGLELRSARKKNSKRQRQPWAEYLLQHARKRVETSFSTLTSLFPKSIHAVTPQGFELKVFCFVLAFAFLSL